MRTLIHTIPVVVASALTALALVGQGGARSAEVAKCSSVSLPSGVVLTGTWTSTDGLYYLRQKGSCLWWVGGKTRSNVFFGSVTTGVWADIFAGTNGDLKLSSDPLGKRLSLRSSTGSLFPAKFLTRR